MTSTSAALLPLLRRDRWIVIGGLVTIVALSWLYLAQLTSMDMPSMGDMAMPTAPMPWTPGYFVLMLFMWTVMMAAMMLPSAAPVILLYATIARQRRGTGAAVPGAGLFALGYIAVWAGFSFLATSLQWALDQAALLSPQMASGSAVISGLVLVAAGFYQWTPLKQACLRQCRSPLDFLLVNWRDGARGATAMGARHGLFCLGCCWVLMLLLFVGGIMNMLWVAVLALYVFIEKLAPKGLWIGRTMGILLALWGFATLANGFGKL